MDVQQGDVVRLTQDWTVLTQGQRYVVLDFVESKQHGPSAHLGLLEPGGHWSAHKWVPESWLRYDKAATSAWKELVLMGPKGVPPLAVKVKDPERQSREPGRCCWFLFCENDAESQVEHPTLGWVPICPKDLKWLADGRNVEVTDDPALD